MIPIHCTRPEDIFNLTAEELEGMTDQELEQLFAPVLHITRPELARNSPDGEASIFAEVTRKSGSKTAKMSVNTDAAFANARAIAAKLGLKFP